MISVVGAGNIGLCIVAGLSKLGYAVTAVDKDVKSLDKVNEWRECHTDSAPINTNHNIPSCDLVISAAPYTANPTIFGWCVENKVPYIDLGGDDDTCKYIEKIAAVAKIPTLTEMGLSPGLSCILAYNLIATTKKKPEKVVVRVGGLPQDRKINYALQWSAEGLYNNYTKPCQIIRDGVIETVTPFSGWQPLINEEYDLLLEAFHTHAGASKLLGWCDEVGIKNFAYQTLRYPFHYHDMRLLLNRFKASKAAFIEFMEREYPPIKDDMVVIQIKIDHNSKWWVFKSNEWTAMQYTTAWPVVAAADLFMRGLIEKKPNLSYQDIPYEEFSETLNRLGMII